MKILLIDDSKIMRNIQKRILGELATPEFIEANDGVEGLAMFAKEPFDLVMVDWNMPNMDGITFLRHVRANDKKTPVIMVTTEVEKSRILDAIKSGANNYVVKPFTPETLLEKVRQTLAKATVPAPAAA